jgi:endoglucanase Acf2
MIRKFLCLFLAGMVALSVFSLPNPVFAGTEPQLICKDPVAGNYSITFSWEQVPGAAGYIIYNYNTAGETVSKLTAFLLTVCHTKQKGYSRQKI